VVPGLHSSAATASLDQQPALMLESDLRSSSFRLSLQMAVTLTGLWAGSSLG
jgi:hypothetical protein